MTDHPAKGCSKRQRAAFEQICIGEDGYHHPSTLAALMKKNLIIEREETEIFAGMKYRIKRYDVPLHLHRRWCEWCSEQKP